MEVNGLDGFSALVLISFVASSLFVHYQKYNQLKKNSVKDSKALNE